MGQLDQGGGNLVSRRGAVGWQGRGRRVGSAKGLGRGQRDRRGGGQRIDRRRGGGRAADCFQWCGSLRGWDGGCRSRYGRGIGRARRGSGRGCGRRAQGRWDRNGVRGRWRGRPCFMLARLDRWDGCALGACSVRDRDFGAGGCGCVKRGASNVRRRDCTGARGRYGKVCAWRSGQRRPDARRDRWDCGGCYHLGEERRVRYRWGYLLDGCIRRCVGGACLVGRVRRLDGGACSFGRRNRGPWRGYGHLCGTKQVWDGAGGLCGGGYRGLINRGGQLGGHDELCRLRDDRGERGLRPRIHVIGRRKRGRAGPCDRKRGRDGARGGRVQRLGWGWHWLRRGVRANLRNGWGAIRHYAGAGDRTLCSGWQLERSCPGPRSHCIDRRCGRHRRAEV